MRKMGVIMNLLMGFFMSLILSFTGTMFGGHFTVPGWLMSFGISLIISWVIGFIVPIKKLGDAFCNKCKTNPMSFKGTLLSALISNAIYTPFITVVMVCVMVTNAAKHAPEGMGPRISQVLPGSLVVCLIVGYIAICILQPLLLKLLMKGKKDEKDARG